MLEIEMKFRRRLCRHRETPAIDKRWEREPTIDEADHYSTPRIAILARPMKHFAPHLGEHNRVTG